MSRTEDSTEELLDHKNLSNLAPTRGSRRRRKRLGIGEGSGNGKTAGKGQKGQRMRAGFRLPAGFEGGQMPLHRRLPKVGFTSRKKVAGENLFTVVQLRRLAALEADGVPLTLERLKELGVIRSLRKPVKLLGGGELSAALTVQAHAVSAGALAAIEKAGGSVEIVPLAR